MIPMMMIGLAALLMTATVISLQIGSARETSLLSRIGLIGLFLFNSLICIGLIAAAI